MTHSICTILQDAYSYQAPNLHGDHINDVPDLLGALEIHNDSKYLNFPYMPYWMPYQTITTVIKLTFTSAITDALIMKLREAAIPTTQISKSSWQIGYIAGYEPSHYYEARTCESSWDVKWQYIATKASTI